MINRSIICSDDKFKFGCWILNTSDRYFSVEIGTSKEVGDLKKRIKKEMKPKLDHLPAVELDIWKVSASSWHVSMRMSDIWVAISTHSFC